MSSNEFPTFATNRPDVGQTVGAAIEKMFKVLREGSATTPAISIATAYINPGGFALLSTELEAASKVRLLIGAEPEFEAQQSYVNNDADKRTRLKLALQDHDKWLAAERDSTGFTREAVDNAKAMVEWLRSETDGLARVEVRRFPHGFLHGKAFISEGLMKSAIAGSSNFTYAGLAKNAEINLGTYGPNSHASDVLEWFDHYWNQSTEFDLAALYETQWNPHQPWFVFMRMLEALYGAHMDEEGATGQLGLTAFQRDGVARMRRLLEANGGVLVADEVGLGKSYLAGEVIKAATEVNRQRAVVICPASLKKGMWEPFLEQHGFTRNVAVYSYEEIRNKTKVPNEPGDGASASELRKYENQVQKWKKFQNRIEDFALIVVDEAHNLRNDSTSRAIAVDNLILGSKHPKQVILLTATPVNNSLYDLESLIKYFIRNDAQFAGVGIPSIREYIKRAQEMDPENLTPDHLFDLMDQVAVRRTRKFVKENYSGDKIVGRDGVETTISFPTPKSRRIEYDLTGSGKALVERMLYALSVDVDGQMNSHAFRRDDPDHLMLARYTPSAYRLDGDLARHQVTNAGLLRSALLKRMESSPAALAMTLKKLVAAHNAFIHALELGVVAIGSALLELTSSDDEDFVQILENFDLDERTDLNNADEYRMSELLADVENDRDLLEELVRLADDALNESDPKFEKLVVELSEIAVSAKRIDALAIPEGDKRKVIIFSSFADTVIDIHRRLTRYIDAHPDSPISIYKGRIGEPVMGAYASVHNAGASGGVDQGGRAALIAGFAPKTAGEIVNGVAVDEDRFDILVTTDVLAEGVNLQQASQIINYDLPWNPMRIVQRHGRVDRIGSQHPYVHLGLYFPGDLLDEMLGLEATLERKLAQANAAVGEHIDVFAKGRARTEVILSDKSMEKMDELLETRGGSSAISGEEFRRRLHLYLKRNDNKLPSRKLPFGSGSGFVNPKISGNGYVFCVKIADHELPWFRFVEVGPDWVPILVEGKPKISSESLVSLFAADPETESRQRELSNEAYSAAFSAWELAQSDIFDEWTQLTDPSKTQPRPPKAFREAYSLISAKGMHLDVALRNEILLKLNTVPSGKIERAVRRTLNSSNLEAEIIAEIVTIIEQSGIPPQTENFALPPVNVHEIRLVAWMAVQGNLSG